MGTDTNTRTASDRQRRVIPLSMAFATLALFGCSTDRVASPAANITTFDATWSVVTTDGQRILRTVTRIPTNGPFDVAVRADGIGLVTHPQLGLASIINSITPSIPGVIDVQCPAPVAFDPSGNIAYMGDQCDRDIAVVDVASKIQIDSIPIGFFSTPSVLVVSRDGSHIYVGTDRGEILSVNTITRAVENTLSTGSFGTIKALVLDTTGTTLYAAGGSQSVQEVDLATFTIRRSIVTGGSPSGMTLTADGKRLLVANASGYLSDIDLRTGQLSNTALAAGANDIVGIPRARKSVMSLDSFTGTLQMYDEVTRQLTQSLVLTGDPNQLAFSSASQTLIALDDSFFGGVIYFIK